MAGGQSQGGGAGPPAGLRPRPSSLKLAEGTGWCDGQFLPADKIGVSLVDPALQSGIAVFETLAVRDGCLVDWRAHLERLRLTAAELGIDVPGDATLLPAAEHIAAAVHEGYGWIKLTALRGGQTAIYGGRQDPATEGEAVSAVVLPWRLHRLDPTVGIKTLNYGRFALGLEYAQVRGAADGLWRNERGHLTEGCASSLFVVKRRAVFTAAERDGLLPGVTRSQVLEAVRAMKLRLHEGKLRPPRLYEADEAFLTSSLRGVRPLIEVDGKRIGSGRPGPLTRAIAERVAALREVHLPAPAPSSASGGS